MYQTNTSLRTLNARVLALVSLLAALVLSGCATQPQPSAEAPANTGADSETDVVVQKSPNDPRDYRYLVLPNELRVLLVSDPRTERAAASTGRRSAGFGSPTAAVARTFCMTPNWLRPRQWWGCGAPAGDRIARRTSSFGCGPRRPGRTIKGTSSGRVQEFANDRPVRRLPPGPSPPHR